MKVDFLCDQCRKEKDVVITKGRGMPRIKRDDEDGEDEETGA